MLCFDSTRVKTVDMSLNLSSQISQKQMRFPELENVTERSCNLYEVKIVIDVLPSTK